MKWFQSTFTKKKNLVPEPPAQVFFHNTLHDKKELFVPLKAGTVSMYSCGPTVYSRAHIGNLRAYVFADTIVRTLRAARYHVRQVINITDVGHMVGDVEMGEDKMSVSAAKEHLTPEAIADRYAKLFIEDLDDLNIDTADILFPRATAYIREQIALAQTIEQKGFAYTLPDGLYFDTEKFVGYGKLGDIAHVDLEAGARVKVVGGKHHPRDFVLWRTAKPHDLQQWDSPWGRGNPGWHLECSAMIRALLGQEIDIHTGGEDHIAVHHNNEIAQSEVATGRPFVRYWIHNAFLTMDGEKASKSLGNIIYLSDLTEKNISPIALRYFFLQAQYRTPLSFSWNALEAATGALERLWKLSQEIATESKRIAQPSEALNRFLVAMRDDLSTPQAIGILWESLKSDEYTPEEKWALLKAADAHLGLLLENPPASSLTLDFKDVPLAVQELLTRRSAARAMKDFAEADRLREEIQNSGYRVDDGPKGEVLTRTTF